MEANKHRGLVQARAAVGTVMRLYEGGLAVADIVEHLREVSNLQHVAAADVQEVIDEELGALAEHDNEEDYL